MRDLKHLTYFEDLLQEANNALVVQAQAEGKKCVAFVCENTPEPLMNLDNTFGVRLHAPNTGSMDIATYYMTSLLCETSRSLLERAVEGGFNFADCVIAPDGCTMINRCVENMELLKTMGAGKDHFFYEYMEIPLKADDNGVDLLVLQCKNHILKPLHDAFGTDVSDAAIRRAAAEHNRVCALIRALGDFRKEVRPRITGYEFHVLTLATYVAPKYLLIDKLEETLEEVRSREPEERAYRARIALVGSEVDDSEFIRLIEDTGAYVCADRFCFGSLRLASGTRPDRAHGRGGRAHADLPPVCLPRPVPAHDEHGKGLRPQAVRGRHRQSVQRRRHPLSADQVLRPVGI